METTTTTADTNFASPDGAPIYRFCITGGPCGGKTTALARVFMFLRERGFEVVTCPEAFTMLVSNGMSLDFFAVDGMAHYVQGAVMETQMTLENSVYKVLKAVNKPAVILSDRGTMDGSVYMSDAEWGRLMKEKQTDRVTLRDTRYDAVFHLVTAADGAEKFYTLANNEVRTESIASAVDVDHKTQKAWVGHPHLYVIDNSTDFEGKMSRLIDVIAKIVGLPSNLRRRSAKFLLKPNLQDRQQQHDITQCFPANINYRIFDVEKIYLKQSTPERVAAGDYSFIRRRTTVDQADGVSESGSVYQLTVVKQTDGEMIELKRIISEREYRTAALSRDESRHIVQQRRVSFLYAKQSFAIHIYQKPVDGLMILHAQVEAKNNDETDNVAVNLPPFLPVERRLTNSKEDEKAYGAYSISLKKKEQQQDAC